MYLQQQPSTCLLAFFLCSANPPSGIEEEAAENGVAKPVTYISGFEIQLLSV
jgi:hypothetical protein